MADIEQTQGTIQLPNGFIPPAGGWTNQGDEYGGPVINKPPPLSPQVQPDILQTLGSGFEFGMLPFTTPIFALGKLGEANVPLVSGIAGGIGTTVGALSTPIGALALASGNKDVRKAYDIGSQTLDQNGRPSGQTPGPLDVGALVRGLESAGAKGMELSGNQAMNPNLPLGQRLFGAGANVALNAAPLMVAPFAKGTSSFVRKVHSIGEVGQFDLGRAQQIVNDLRGKFTDQQIESQLAATGVTPENIAKAMGREMTPAEMTPAERAAQLNTEGLRRDIAENSPDSPKYLAAKAEQDARLEEKISAGRALKNASGTYYDPAVLTRAIEAQIGTPEIAVSRHDVFGPYDKRMGDLNTATNAVFARDPKAIELLGPELTNALRQNKAASDLVNKMGWSEENAAAAITQATLDFSNGPEAAILRDAIGGGSAEVDTVAQRSALDRSLANVGLPPTDAIRSAVTSQVIETGKKANDIRAEIGGGATPSDRAALAKLMEAGGATPEEIYNTTGIGNPPSRAGGGGGGGGRGRSLLEEAAGSGGSGGGNPRTVPVLNKDGTWGLQRAGTGDIRMRGERFASERSALETGLSRMSDVQRAAASAGTPDLGLPQLMSPELANATERALIESRAAAEKAAAKHAKEVESWASGLRRSDAAKRLAKENEAAKAESPIAANAPKDMAWQAERRTQNPNATPNTFDRYWTIMKSLTTALTPFHGQLRQNAPMIAVDMAMLAGRLAGKVAGKDWGRGTLPWTSGWRVGFDLMRDPKAFAQKVNRLQYEMEQWIKDHPGAERLVMSKPGRGIVGGEEEAMAGTFLDRIPGFTGSHTLFTMVNNTVRFNRLKNLVEGGELTGQRLSKSQINDIADSINTLTAKIGVPESEKHAALLRMANMPFFSPSMKWTRVKIYTDAIGAIPQFLASGGKDPVARQKVLGGVSHIAALVTMKSLANAAGFNVNTDMTSDTPMTIDMAPVGGAASGAIAAMASQLGLTAKIQNGRVMLDFSTGEAPYIKLLVQEILGTKNNVGQWEHPALFEKPLSPILDKFIPNSLAPGWWEAFQAGTGHGDRIDVRSMLATMAGADFLKGSGIVETPNYRDGIGRLDNGALPATPVTDAWADTRNKNPGMSDLVPPSKKIGTIELTNAEADKLSVIVGQQRNTALTKYVTSPQYQADDPLTRRKTLEQIRDQATEVGKIAYGIQAAKGAKNDVDRTAGATIALGAAGSKATKMGAISALAAQGSLTQAVGTALDDMRKQPNPLKANYEPSVKEYLDGSQLVNNYLATPPFSAGTPQDWQDAITKGNQLRSVYMSIKRQADIAGKKPEQMPDYISYYTKDYAPARTSGNVPISAFVTPEGTLNPGMVNPQRKALEESNLWRMFGDVARQQDPYTIKEPK